MTEFSSVESLVKESWDLFRKKFVSLLIWSVVSWGISIALVVLYIFIFGIFGVGVFATHLDAMNNPAQFMTALFNPALGIGVAILLLGLVAIAIGIGVIVTTGYVSIVTGQSLSIGAMLKKGWGLVLPGIGISLLSMLLVFGGVAVFIIPGIVIGVLLGFSMYELIVNNNRGVNALKRSVAVVSTNFWAIFGRIALLVLIQMLITFVVQLPLSAGGRGMGIGASLSTIISLAFSLFSTVYTILLYKQAEAATPKDKKGSITWMIIVAALGWLLLIMGTSFAIQGLSKVNWPSMFNEMENKQYDTKYSQDMMDGNTTDTQMQDLNNMQQQLHDQYGIPTQEITPTPKVKTRPPVQSL